GGHDDDGKKPSGHDDDGKKPGDDDGGKPTKHDDERTPEQQAHDEARDAEMEADGYPQGTRAKAEETAENIEGGKAPKKDGLRDTEHTAEPRDDPKKNNNDQSPPPAQRENIKTGTADAVRGKPDPTGKLDADIKAAGDKVAADNKPSGTPKP